MEEYEIDYRDNPWLVPVLVGGVSLLLGWRMLNVLNDPEGAIGKGMNQMLAWTGIGVGGWLLLQALD